MINSLISAWQQDSYVTLKDLRDNCKTELEMTSGMPSEKQ